MVCGDKQGTNAGYNKHRRSRDLPACPPCSAANAERSRLYPVSPEANRRHKLKFRYGLSLEVFNGTLAAQGGACKLCLTSEPSQGVWCVDHDHTCCPSESKTCGKCVRGILCGPCNRAIGLLKENTETLKRAIEYLGG